MAKKVESTADRVNKAGSRQADAVGKAMAQISGSTAGVSTATDKMDKAFAQATGSMASQAGRAGRELDAALTGGASRAMENVQRTIRGATPGITAAVDSTYRDINGRLRDQNGKFIRTSEQAGEEAGTRGGSGFSGGFKGALAGIGTAIAAVGFGQLISEATRASDATNKFKSTMQFAGVDTSGIDAAAKAAQSYADQTVYDLPTIQNMLAQLASNGVKDYAELTKAAGNLNAVAGGSADTFGSVAMVMTQTAGQGKLTTENWNQLSDAIPGAAGPLMKALEQAGAYSGNFRDEMSKGAITADEFNAALLKLGTDPVAVEAAKSTKTFEGAIGSLKATVNSGLVRALDAIKPAATGAITALSTGLGVAIDWVTKAIQGLYDLLVKGDFGSAFREAFNVEEDSPIVDLLFRIREGAIGLYDLLTKGDYTGMLYKAFGWEEDSKAVDIILGIRDAALKVPGALQEVMDKGGEFITKLWEFREPITIIAGLILTLLIPRLVQLGIEALKSAAQQKLAWMIAQSAAAKAQVAAVFAAWTIIGGWVMMATVATINAAKMAASWLIAMGPVGWIIGIIALLVGAFVWAYNNVDWFRAGVDAAMKWVGEAFQAAGKWFSDVWNGIVDWITGTLVPIFQGIGQFFVDGWSGIVDWWNNTLMPAVAAVGQWFSDVFTNIGNWLRDFVGFFVDGWGMLVDFYNNNLAPIVRGIGDVFAAVFDWIQRLVWNFTTIAVALWMKLVDLWNGVLSPALQAVGQWFSDIFTFIWESVLKPVIDNIVAGFQRVADFIGSVFTWIYDNVIKPAVDFWVSAFRMVVDWWNLTFLPALQAIGQWFTDVFNWIYNTIILPYITFWIDAFRSIVDWWNLTFLPALQAVGQWFSDVLNWIYESIIKPIIDLFVGAFNGLVDFWNGVLSPAMDAVGKWFSDVIGGAISGVSDFINDLIKGFEGFISFWTNTLKPIADKIGEIFRGIGDAIGTAIDKLGEFANNPLGGIQDLLGIKKDENGQGIMPSNSGGGVYSGGGIATFAGGGVIPGYAPGRDTIPAILSRGEGVAVPELVRAIGPRNFMALNHEYSGGRPAGSGPSRALSTAVGGGSSAGGSTMTVERVEVNINLTGGNGVAVAPADIEAIKEAVEEVFDEMNRRNY
jgi:tape measure domain-containing protein